MTGGQRRVWADQAVNSAPHSRQYEGLSFAEVSLRARALFESAARQRAWHHLANHLALIHVEMVRRSPR